MGTNYYMITEPCPHCHRGGGKVHIGKDSVGWSFVFAEQPDLNIHSVGDWFGQLIATDATILNEYNEEIPVEDFVEIVKQSQNDKSHAEVYSEEQNCYLDKYGYSFIKGDFS